MNRCEATIGVIRADYGFRPQQCHQYRGLRTFFDGEGVAHYACPALGHMAQVVRRFGAMPALTPTEHSVYASLADENAYFRAHEDDVDRAPGEWTEEWGR